MSRRGIASCRLPGLAAPIVVHEASDGFGRGLGLIEVPSTGHYSAVFECAGGGAGRADAGQVDRWVAYWGAWLASQAAAPGIVAAAVSVETHPDRTLRSARVTPRVCLTFAAAASTGGARRRDAEEMAAEIGARLPGLSARLSMAGAGDAVPMSERQVAEMVRLAYDPSVHSLVEAARGAGGSGLTWADAGPVMAQESVADYRHDSAASITWGMSQAPQDVVPHLLADLVAPRRNVARKRVTLLYRPPRPAAGQKPATTKAERATPRNSHARGQAQDAGLARFALLVTATVQSYAALPAAESVVDVLTPPARLQLRRMYGAQAAAFAAGLPIGVVLPDHVVDPQFIRELA